MSGEGLEKRVKSLEEAVGNENSALPPEVLNGTAPEVLARARQMETATRQLKQTAKRLQGGRRLLSRCSFFSPFFC